MKCQRRLDALRCLMRERGINGYLVANADPHANEFVAQEYRKREKLTGFTGSAGVAVVTAQHAFLWTDGRYSTQAQKELMDTPWCPRIQKIPGALGIIREIIAWIESNSHEILEVQRGSQDSAHREKCTIAVDAETTTIAEARALEASRAIRLLPLEESLMDAVWKQTEKVHKHDENSIADIFSIPPSRAGATMTEKVNRAVEALQNGGLGGYLFTDLDDIAWMMNLRGKGFVPNCGVFPAYALLMENKECSSQWTLHVFSDVYNKIVSADPGSKLHDSLPSSPTILASHIQYSLGGENNLNLYSYNMFSDWLKNTCPPFDKPLAYGDNVNFALYTALRDLTSNDADRLVCLPSCVRYFRNLKNDAEIEGFRDCHRIDAIAVVRYLHWLEKARHEGQKISESQGASQLFNFRQESPEFIQLSFETISATAANSAIIHYSPPSEGSESNATDIQSGELYLVDSGGHYTCGTTDITRTIYFGDDQPSETQKEVYTRVLKGLVAVHMARFPESYSNAASGYLDSIARGPLWNVGLDYPHGTGHGVGHGLSVHEGPTGIRKSSASCTHDVPEKFRGYTKKYADKSLRPGVIVSNEPGCYIAGKFGVRIENIVCVKKSTVQPLITAQNDTAASNFLELENFTLVPFCRKLIDPSMLTSAEREWINDYYAEIWSSVGAELRKRKLFEVESWLEQECKAL